MQPRLKGADPAQTKTLLQMLIKRIKLDEQRKPESMEICLSRALQRYIEEGPTDAMSVGPLHAQGAALVL